MRDRLKSLPIWARVVGAFVLAFTVSAGGTIFWGTRQQNRLGVELAHRLAEGSAHMAFTAIALAMGSGDPKEVVEVIATMQKSHAIKSLKVVPSEATRKQFGDAVSYKGEIDALEQRAMRDAKPHYGVEERHPFPVYRAILPMQSHRNVVGKDCTTCHQGAEGLVLGALSFEIELDELSHARSDFTRGVVIASLLLGAVLVAGFYLLCRRVIGRPLEVVVSQLRDISEGEGDLTQRLHVRNRDEIGELARWFNIFVEKIQNTVRQMAQNTQALAGSAQQLAVVSQQMASNAEDTSGKVSVVSAASEQIGGNIQTVATGTQEMSASINEIAKNAGEAARVAHDAVQVADKANATVIKLGDSSDEIGAVIKVINSIAEQTNLLALNATIEAARAGEAGKGFAVVANEVKELAKQTGKATEDISAKIQSIQGSTQEAVEAIGNITQVITKINDISNVIASAVEEQSATTGQITRNVGEASKGVGEITHNVDGVAVAAKSTAAGAGETQAAANELARMAAELQALLGQFKYGGEAATENSALNGRRRASAPGTWAATQTNSRPKDVNVHVF